MFYTASFFYKNVIYRVQEARKCRMLILYFEHFLISIIGIIYEVFRESAYISISNDTNNKRIFFSIKFERYIGKKTYTINQNGRQGPFLLIKL